MKLEQISTLAQIVQYAHDATIASKSVCPYQNMEYLAIAQKYEKLVDRYHGQIGGEVQTLMYVPGAKSELYRVDQACSDDASGQSHAPPKEDSVNYDPGAGTTRYVTPAVVVPPIAVPVQKAGFGLWGVVAAAGLAWYFFAGPGSKPTKTKKSRKRRTTRRRRRR